MHFETQASAVGVGATVEEQAVGVTKDPAESKGRYPKQEANSEAQRDRFASGFPRQVLYAVEQADEHSSRFKMGDAYVPVMARRMARF